MSVWDFRSDTGGIDYGTEVGLLAGKTFHESYSFLVKYASYDTGVDTAGSPPAPFELDTEILWLQLQLKF